MDNNKADSEEKKKPNVEESALVPKAVKPAAKSADKLKPTSKAAKTDDPIITTAEAGAEDLETKLNQLSKRIDEQDKKHRSEQRTIIISVLLALVFIAVTVAVEASYFHASANSDVDEVRKQQQDDYRSIRDAMERNKDAANQQIWELKLELQQLKAEQPTSAGQQ